MYVGIAKTQKYKSNIHILYGAATWRMEHSKRNNHKQAMAQIQIYLIKNVSQSSFKYALAI